jgi:hypothetical protein
VIVSTLIGLVVLYLGIAHIGSILYGWMLGVCIAPLMQLAKQPLKKMATKYLNGMYLYSKRKLLCHALVVIFLSLILLITPILTFLIKITSSHNELNIWVKNLTL